METVVTVLIMVVCFNYMLKQSFRKFWSVMISALVAALFVGFTWPLAIEQNRAQINQWLQNPALMRDIAAVLSFDVILQIQFCMLAAHMLTTGLIKKRTLLIYKLLRWFPGILIYPVFFSLLVAFIFAFPGRSFSALAWLLAALIFLMIPVLAWIIGKLLPEKELRLEILFLGNALVALLGIVATVNGRTAIEGQTAPNWFALAKVLLLVTVGVIAGMLLHHFKMKFKLKRAKF